MNHFNYKKDSRGYTLLFAVLTAALVLGVAVFILEVSTKQYELSASARDSMYSFYAADSGIECAALGNLYSSSTSALPWDCDNQTGSVHWPSSPGTDDTSAQKYKDDGHYYEAGFNLSLPGGACAVIDMVSFYSAASPSSPTGYEHDITTSRGYNHCKIVGGVPGPDTSITTTLERALYLSHTTAPAGSY